jgi:MerR family transcriptional regulator/heat shock protein HspR
MSRHYYHLDVVCERMEMPRAQLRRYERMGLLSPSGEPETPHGAPRYTEEDLWRLRRIRRLQRDLGLDLAGVEVVVHLLDQIAELQRLLQQRP